jgi:hypothetical protein
MNREVKEVEEGLLRTPFFPSFFDFFDLAVKNSPNSGNFATVEK